MKFALNFIVASALLVSTSSALAINHKSGVISSIDTNSNVLMVSHANGETASYKITENTKVMIDGERQNLNALTPNQAVTLKIPEVKKSSFVRAEVMSVDQDTGVATVRLMGKDRTTEIQLMDKTKVSGRISNLEELEKGHVIRYRVAGDI